MKTNRYLAVAYISLLVTMVLWASTFVALKLAFRAYDPMVVIFGRMSIASLCALFVPFVFKAVKDVRREDVKYILLMAFCEPCLYFIFEAQALVYTSASQAGIITAMMPLMTALGAWFFLKERLSPRTCIGFGIAAAGAAWLTLASPQTPHGPNPLLGNSLEFMAMACASGYALCCKRLTNRNYDPFFLAFAQSFTGAVFYFPLLFLPGTELPTQIAPVSLGAVVYLGVVVTMGAYGLYNFGVSRIPASQAAAFVNLIPVIGLILSAVVLGERFTSSQYTASAVVLAGVILTQDIRRRKSGPPVNAAAEQQKI